MVLISSGNSEISAHRWNDLCILICLRRLSQEQSQICFFFCKKSVFLYTCATCSQLLSNTSTMDTPNYTGPASFDIIGLSLAINTFTSAGLVFIAHPAAASCWTCGKTKILSALIVIGKYLKTPATNQTPPLHKRLPNEPKH